MNSVSGSPTKLRASQNLVQSDAGRELRGEVKASATNPEDEERLNFNFNWVKQLNTKMKGDPLKKLVKSQFKYAYTDGIATQLLPKLNPDDLVRMFRLTIPANRANTKGVKTRAWDFFLNYRVSYLEKYPQWQSAFKNL
ncbi:hypothetical protein P3T76_009505 [Phytophthora citrophthora]|uniref:RxLR effector protein n=1 Tax=Phytophthora citrophthora TaxID=4793 RepID=A0AAD9GG66_9STRA|nr:hypothetical protein P3T76_009505 [Phytophthora citrophthora]